MAEPTQSSRVLCLPGQGGSNPAAPASVCVDLSAHRPQADGGAPEWVQLIPPGEFSGRDGRGPYHVADPDTLIAAFLSLGMPAAIDYEHQSAEWDGQPGPTPAAGWITAIEHRDGDGIWGRVEWTERAAAMLAAREYRYLSPVFYHLADSGEVVALAGAGLTNQPNLHLRALSRVLHAYHLEPDMPADTDLAERVRYMLELPVTATPAEMVEHLQRLIARLGTADATAAEMRRELGLAAEADDAAVLAALDAQQSDLVVHGTAIEVLAEHTGAPRTESGALLPAEVVQHAIRRLADASGEAEELRTAAHKAEAEHLIAELMRERVLTPAEADAWGRDLAAENPERLRAICGTREPIIAEPARGGKGGDAAADEHEYLALVRQRQSEHGETRGAAMMRVGRTHPDLHRDWLDSQRAAG
jgi:phage I-like protein